VALERAEYNSTFREAGDIDSGKIRRRRLIGICVDVLGAHPLIILGKEQEWLFQVPDHLRMHVRQAAKRYHGFEIQPILMEKLHVGDLMEGLELDDYPTTAPLLHTIRNQIEVERLRSISLANNITIRDSTVAILLRGCVSLSHLNLRGCVNVKNGAFTEKVVQSLTELSYLNVSYTQVTGKALSMLYSNCPKLSNLKLAGCKITEGTNIQQLFPHQSDVLTNLKIRHCAWTPAEMEYILKQFPNLQTLDCSSPTGSNPLSFRPFINIDHPSQVRKFNFSNCPGLEYKPREVRKFFELYTKLEHLYLTAALLHEQTRFLQLLIPKPTLQQLKTAFLPGLRFAELHLSTFFDHATNLEHLDVSKTHTTFTTEILSYMHEGELCVSHLRILSLEDNPVSDESASLICCFPTLRSLFLRGASISRNGLRDIVYGCPWLEKLDLASCRGIDVRERRSLLRTLREEFREHLEEARRAGKVLKPESQKWYCIRTFTSDGEERDGLVLSLDRV